MTWPSIEWGRFPTKTRLVFLLFIPRLNSEIKDRLNFFCERFSWNSSSKFWLNFIWAALICVGCSFSKSLNVYLFTLVISRYKWMYFSILDCFFIKARIISRTKIFKISVFNLRIDDNSTNNQPSGIFLIGRVLKRIGPILAFFGNKKRETALLFWLKNYKSDRGRRPWWLLLRNRYISETRINYLA